MKFCMNCMSQYGDDYQICPHCGFQEGTLPTDSRCMEPGVILADRYIVGMPLAADSWTIRYIGWDALTEQKVTVNEFFPTRFAVREMGKTALTVVKQEPFYHHMSALLRRSRLLAETRLPETVCPVYESFEKNGTAYVITAHVEGQPMRDFLAERAPVSEAEAERLMLPVMRALDKLHENGFIAGGFSPDHFTVVNGQPVLCDFIANCFFHVTDNPADIREEQYDSFYPPERLTPSETIRLAPENDVYSAAMIFYALLGIELPDGKARTENYQRRHKDILKKPSACGVKMDKSKENALINAAAPAVPIRTSDMETFIRELTSDREVPIKANAGKGFPLWAKIAIPAAAVVLIAAAILLIPMLFSKGVKDLPLDDKTVVPNVVSLTAEKAEQELQKAGLLLEIEGKTIDDSVDENLVLAQSVQQGEMVGVNSAVGVTVSAHSSEFSMPNFVGMQLAGCTDIMQQLGISYSTSAEYSESVAEGCVISQSVTPFTKVKAGQPLELTVSKGADPAMTDKSGSGYDDGGYSSGGYSEPAVSDYREQPYDDVIEQAAEEHTPIEITDRVVDDSLPEGTVLEQSPAAGEERKADEPVKLVVSTKGGTVILPDLTLMNRDIVEYILIQYGLVPEFESDYSETVAEGLVSAHDPAEDAEVESGSIVKATVSMGKPRIEMPDVTGADAKTAAEQLRELGIAFTLMYDSDASKEAGVVLRQNVRAGDGVVKGQEVILTVNAPDGVSRVPDVIGLEVEDADKLAQDAGLNLLIFVDRDHPYSEGKVYAQGPKSGTFIERGSDLVVFLTGKQEEPSGPPSLEISTHAATIGVGQEFVLGIEAKNIQELTLVNYEISDPQVADVVKIDKKTLAMTFRGLKAGTAQVVISCGELKQVCTVTVQ